MGGIGLGGRLVADAPGLAAPVAERGGGRGRLGVGGVRRPGGGGGEGRRGWRRVVVVVVVIGGVGRPRIGLAAALALAAGGVAVADHGGELGFRLAGGGRRC